MLEPLVPAIPAVLVATARSFPGRRTNRCIEPDPLGESRHRAAGGHIFDVSLSVIIIDRPFAAVLDAARYATRQERPPYPSHHDARSTHSSGRRQFPRCRSGRPRRVRAPAGVARPPLRAGHPLHARAHACRALAPPRADILVARPAGPAGGLDRRRSPHRSAARSATPLPGCACAAASGRGIRTGRSCRAPSWRLAAACRGSAPGCRRSGCNGGNIPTSCQG